MVDMLKGTVEEPGGTSRAMKQVLRADNEICGKTGTTSNQSDGWFVGMIRNLCAGVWVGGEDRCIHFRNLALGSGAHTAMPIWEKFILSIYEDPELPYKKGPLLDDAKPCDIEIPGQREPYQRALPIREAEQGQDIMEEETTVEVDLDVNEIL